MEVADKSDLTMASEQGTILRIRAFGKVYGKGGYFTPMNKAAVITLVVIAYVGCVIAFFIYQMHYKRKIEVKEMPEPLKETLNKHSESEEDGDVELSTRTSSDTETDDNNKCNDDDRALAKQLSSESRSDQIPNHVLEGARSDDTYKVNNTSSKNEYIAPTPNAHATLTAVSAANAPDRDKDAASETTPRTTSLAPDDENDLSHQIYGVEAKISPSEKYTIVSNTGDRFETWINIPNENNSGNKK